MNLKKLEKILSNVLFLGVITSSVLIIFAILFGTNKTKDIESYRYNFSNVIDGIVSLDSATYYMLGIFFLILTPIIRIIAMKIQFIIVKDYTYVKISSIVIVVLIISMILGVTH